MRAQVFGREPVRQETVEDHGAQEGLHAWISEGQRRHPLAVHHLRTRDLSKRGLANEAIVAELLDVERLCLISALCPKSRAFASKV